MKGIAHHCCFGPFRFASTKKGVHMIISLYCWSSPRQIFFKGPLLLQNIFFIKTQYTIEFPIARGFFLFISPPERSQKMAKKCIFLKEIIILWTKCEIPINSIIGIFVFRWGGGNFSEKIQIKYKKVFMEINLTAKLIIKSTQEGYHCDRETKTVLFKPSKIPKYP